LHETLFKVLGHEEYKSFFDIELTESRERYFYLRVSENAKAAYVEYLVPDRISGFNSLQKTGNVYSQKVERKKYEYGTVLTFGYEPSGALYVVSGVPAADVGLWSWTVGKECVFEIPLKKTPKNDLMVVFELAAVYTSNGPQQVIGYVNGEKLFHDELSSQRKFSFIVPKSIIDKNNTLTIRLELPNAISPKEMGESADSRQVALGLDKLIIDEIK